MAGEALGGRRCSWAPPGTFFLLGFPYVIKCAQMHGFNVELVTQVLEQMRVRLAANKLRQGYRARQRAAFALVLARRLTTMSAEAEDTPLVRVRGHIIGHARNTM